jgi:hypothetical protein
MQPKHVWPALWLLGFLALGILLADVPLEAASRAIPSIVNTAAMVADTIKAIGVLFCSVLIIVAAVQAAERHIGGMVWAIVLAVLCGGFILFADQIVSTIAPGSALAATGRQIPAQPWVGLWTLGQQLLSLSPLAEGIRRVRRA